MKKDDMTHVLIDVYLRLKGIVHRLEPIAQQLMDENFKKNAKTPTAPRLVN